MTIKKFLSGLALFILLVVVTSPLLSRLAVAFGDISYGDTFLSPTIVNGNFTAPQISSAVGVVPVTGDVSINASGVATIASISGVPVTAPASATINLGAADNNAPVVQSFGVQNVAAGNLNLAGALRIFNASQGTGQGAGGGYMFNTAPASSVSGVSRNPETNAVSIDQYGRARLAISGGSPTIASGACGTTTNGAISSVIVANPSDHDFGIAIGSATTTTCTVTFSQAWTTAPHSCTFSPANSTAAGTSILAYSTTPSTTSWALKGSVLASTNWVVRCE
jgi:hypothetical protein